MAFSISRWLRPDFPTCLICGKHAYPSSQSPFSPVRHPVAKSVLRQICLSCANAVPWIKSPVCRICGRPEACMDCPRRTERHIAFCRSAVRYDNQMKDLLALYKYRGSERLEPLMAAILASGYERICREIGSGGHDRQPFHAVTSVPLARERLEERGFNQAERMACKLADWYGLTYQPLLQRNRHTEKQSLKNRRSRLADMKGNFAAAEPFEIRQEPHSSGPIRILLVDDIYTTGSTVNECANALRTAFSDSKTTVAESLQIYGLLWARS
jgi:competence protein ComFC